MEFCESLIPVCIKYDFITETAATKKVKDWVECRLHLTPAADFHRNIFLHFYPKLCNESSPVFAVDIHCTNVTYGPVKSRSQKNVFGISWCMDEKNCRIYIAFENKVMHQNFGLYFRKVVKIFNPHNNCENDVDSTVCNEAEQMTTPQVMRITDETGSYEDVVLRTKDNPTRRLARSLAVLSGLFNLNRESGENQDKKDEFRAARKKSWNIFKPKKKCVIETPSFQHFQEPLNIERLSFPISPIDNRDLEWYDLNKEEMNKIEMRMSDILNKFNSFSPTNYDYKLESPTESLAGSPDSECELQSECESQFLCRYDQNLSISSNILRSHNLSASCQSTDNNALNVNLRGPSTSKAQIHAPNIEEDEQKISRTVNCESGVMSDVTSIASTDSATIQSNRKKYVDSTMQFHRSSSSGFGSEYDEKSPTKFAPLTNSSPLSSPTAQCTSNYSNEHLRITPIKEKTPLMTPKKGYSSLQWAKLLQIQHGKYRLSQQDVTPTQRTKTPFEYIRRAWKPTMPFKMRLSIPADDVATKHSFEI